MSMASSILYSVTSFDTDFFRCMVLLDDKRVIFSRLAAPITRDALMAMTS